MPLALTQMSDPSRPSTRSQPRLPTPDEIAALGASLNEALAALPRDVPVSPEVMAGEWRRLLATAGLLDPHGTGHRLGGPPSDIVDTGSAPQLGSATATAPNAGPAAPPLSVDADALKAAAATAAAAVAAAAAVTPSPKQPASPAAKSPSADTAIVAIPTVPSTAVVALAPQLLDAPPPRLAALAVMPSGIARLPVPATEHESAAARANALLALLAPSPLFAALALAAPASSIAKIPMLVLKAHCLTGNSERERASRELHKIVNSLVPPRALDSMAATPTAAPHGGVPRLASLPAADTLVLVARAVRPSANPLCLAEEILRAIVLDRASSAREHAQLTDAIQSWERQFDRCFTSMPDLGSLADHVGVDVSGNSTTSADRDALVAELLPYVRSCLAVHHFAGRLGLLAVLASQAADRRAAFDACVQQPAESFDDFRSRLDFAYAAIDPEQPAAPVTAELYGRLHASVRDTLARPAALRALALELAADPDNSTIAAAARRLVRRIDEAARSPGTPPPTFVDAVRAPAFEPATANENRPLFLALIAAADTQRLRSAASGVASSARSATVAALTVAPGATGTPPDSTAFATAVAAAVVAALGTSAPAAASTPAPGSNTAAARGTPRCWHCDQFGHYKAACPSAHLPVHPECTRKLAERAAKPQKK